MTQDPFSNSDPFRKKSSFAASGVTVMVRYTDGKVSAHHKITNPWPYMLAMKKHADVKSVWIDENK